MNDGLKAVHRAAIVEVLAANERVERAVLFGSRAMGTGTMDSDVDIALFGDRLTLTDQARLAMELEDIPMAQSVDLVLHGAIDHRPLLEHILTHGIGWYRRSTASPTLNLPEPDRERILSLLREHLPGVEVWAYGSRVTGRSHDGSDLDLALRGPELQEIPAGQLADFEEAVRASRIPFRVEARDWARLPEGRRPEIERGYVLLNKEHLAWATKSLGECAVLVRDPVSPASVPDLPYIGLEHIGQGTLSILVSGLSESVSSAKIRFFARDILFGKLRPYFRKVVRPGFDGICSTDIWVVRSAEGVDQGFLFYVMASQEFIEAAAQGSEGTRMPRAKWDYVSRLNIAVPPLPEQRAIAHILDTLDDKIESNRRMNETLEAMARALFKSWFIDFDPVRAKMAGRDTGLPKAIADLFPDRLVDSELGEIPEGWDVQKLSDVAEGLRQKENPLKSPDAMYQHFSIPAYDDSRSPAVELGERIKSLKSQVPPGVVLLSKLNPSIERVWLVDVRPEDQAVCSTEFLVLAPRPEYSRAYLYCLVRSSSFRRRLEGLVTGTSKSHQRAPANSTLGLTVVRPPKQLVRLFAGVVELLLAQTLQCRQESRTLAALRDTLLPKLVSGELRVPDAERLAEEAA